LRGRERGGYLKLESDISLQQQGGRRRRRRRRRRKVYSKLTQ